MKQDPVAADDPDMDLKKVYKIMWNVCELKREFMPSRQASKGTEPEGVAFVSSSPSPSH